MLNIFKCWTGSKWKLLFFRSIIHIYVYTICQRCMKNIIWMSMTYACEYPWNMLLRKPLMGGTENESPRLLNTHFRGVDEMFKCSKALIFCNEIGAVHCEGVINIFIIVHCQVCSKYFFLISLKKRTREIMTDRPNNQPTDRQVVHWEVTLPSNKRLISG